MTTMMSQLVNQEAAKKRIASATFQRHNPYFLLVQRNNYFPEERLKVLPVSQACVVNDLELAQTE